jgi:hypothetical protein
LTVGPTAVRALPGWLDAPDPVLLRDGAVAVPPPDGAVAVLPLDGAVAAGLAEAEPAAGIVPMLRGAGRVWNSSTPMRPARVAVITIGVRLMVPGLRECALCSSLSGLQNPNVSVWICSGAAPSSSAEAAISALKPSGPQM